MISNPEHGWCDIQIGNWSGKLSYIDIDELLAKSKIKVETVFDKVTVVSCKLPNGFVIVEASGAVDPKNYNEQIGKKICMERIENKLWELEGYALTKKLYERNEGC
jgi:hypothetical protein